MKSKQLSPTEKCIYFTIVFVNTVYRFSEICLSCILTFKNQENVKKVANVVDVGHFE